MSDLLAVREGALQAAILLILRGYTSRSVISTNHVMQKVRHLLAECDACDQELIRAIRETALLLGLIPVFDPRLSLLGPDGSA